MFAIELPTAGTLTAAIEEAVGGRTAARKGTDSLAAVGEIKAVGLISESAQPLSGGSVS